MRKTKDLLRFEPRARVFFAALTQSSLGTGAGYVALLLIAYERYRSPWAISIVLAADLLPAMFLGPMLGAVADRFSRRACLVVADVLRAGAFAGIAFVDGFGGVVALAVVAGMGTALFNPASLAALPSLVTGRRLPAATALYGAVADLGYTAGPALAALLLVTGDVETIMLLNAVTFAISAVVLGRLAFGGAPSADGSQRARGRTSLARDTREGMRSASLLPGLRTVLFASSAALFFAGAFNVAEPLLATQELGAGGAGFALLVAMFGGGFITGSLAGSSGGTLAEIKYRYLCGLGLNAFGCLASGLAPGVAVALVTFALAGFGNGLILVHERLLVQQLVPNALAGRIFGLRDALTAWAFALAFVATGALLGVIGVRATIIAAGCGGLLAFAAATLLLRDFWRSPGGSASQPAAPARTRGEKAPVL